MEFFKSIQDIDKLQSLEMAQKAKIKWSIEGDENSSFYHGALNKKRSQLNIRGIIVEGIWTDSPQMSWSLKFLKRAVLDCGIDKSLGPDGFTFGFYRQFWKVIENDVFETVKHFFTYGDIPKGCNSSFIALIPKIPDANVTMRCLWDSNAMVRKWVGQCIGFKLGVRLESICSHFFNGHDLNSKKMSWVKWKNVLASKEKGGLGVSSLYALNRGLMFKWVWRFLTQSTSLWVRVIKAIHGDDGKLDKQLGNGDKTAFWEDVWIGSSALKVLYPRMYALETCKSVKVGTKLAHSSLDFSFRRRPRGGVEQEQYGALSGQVHDVTLVPLSDRRKWSLENSGDFSVASVRKMIDDKMLPDVTTKTRWIKSVPIKVNVHA
ncbi:hypothetical protein Tco_1378686 [Tanacetum coccineum]